MDGEHAKMYVEIEQKYSEHDVEPKTFDGTRDLFTLVYVNLSGGPANIWTCLRSAENIDLP